MPLEEPDTATAGAGSRDREGDDTRGRRVALVLSAAVLTMLLAGALWIVTTGGAGRERERATVARSETPSHGSVPGAPVVSVGPAGSNGCTASWTADDGGSPIIEFFVTRESEPTPPGPDGVEVDTALQIERTTAATTTVGPGWTVRITAWNTLGQGPASEPIRCG